MDKNQMKFNKEIGMRIRGQREFLNYTREELSEKCDISTQFLADIETGRKSMTIKTLSNISKCLSVSADYILTGSTDNPNASPHDKQISLLLERLTPWEKDYAVEILKLYTKALSQSKRNDVFEKPE